MKVSGNKASLRKRLEDFDSSKNTENVDTVTVDEEKAIEDAVAMEHFFCDGLDGVENDGDEDSDQGEEDLEEGLEEEVLDNNKTHGALAWADKFILDTRRKGGRQTENSVLKLWKVRIARNSVRKMQ